MFSRTALRTAFNVRKTPSTSSSTTTTTTKLPTNHLQHRSLHQENASTTKSPNPPTPLAAESTTPTSPPAAARPSTAIPTPPSNQPIAPTHTTAPKLTRSLLKTLPFLTGQQSHYITAHLHARPYLVTAGDHVRLPFRMPKVEAGDVLRFNRASALGSRDFTLKGAPYIDERLFECRVRVLGVDSEPMRIKEKTKRRQRHVKRVRSKHRYTLLRVMDLRVKS
ncbi:Ribosomal protein, partial [Aspergillus sp. HF37]